MKAFLLALLLSGCATFDQAYVTPPTLNAASIGIVWTTQAVISAPDGVCGDAAAGWLACGGVGTKASPFSIIYAQMPESFSDLPRVCALGHEVLHAFGATHK